MNNLRARVFAPALFVQLFFLTLAQSAFSQETQTTAQPTQPVAAVVTPEKVAAKDEACEQSPPAAPAPAAAPAAAPADMAHASVAQAGADKTATVSNQPVSFPSARTLKNDAARPFLFAAATRPATKSLHAFDLSAQNTPGGAPPTPYTPLTSDQKMRRAFKSAFLTPQAYALPLVSAIMTEWGEDDLPHKETEDRVADGLSRFAIKFGRRSTNNLLGGGVFPSLFRQDPRYERAGSDGFGARAAHAVSRIFVTRGDNGRLQPNYSRFAGQLSSSALSNLWEQSTPGHDRIGTDATFRRFGTSFLTGAVFNVLREFAPDIKKVFGR
jgi:hypothetical protein